MMKLHQNVFEKLYLINEIKRYIIKIQLRSVPDVAVDCCLQRPYTTICNRRKEE